MTSRHLAMYPQFPINEYTVPSDSGASSNKIGDILVSRLKGILSSCVRRVGLVKRSAAVLSVTLIMAASSVAYANDPSPINQSVFSIACGAIVSSP